MTHTFGPQGSNAAKVQPSGVSQQRYDTQTWVRDCSAPGAPDGTVLDAAFYNRIIAALDYVVSTSGVNALPGDPSVLYRAFLEILGRDAPEALDTLRELAEALNNDEHFAANVVLALSKRLKVDELQGLSLYEQTMGRVNLGLHKIASTGQYADLMGLPTLFDGTYASLSGKPTLGTAAALDVGTTANKVVQLTAAGKLPGVDGSLLTGIGASADKKNYLLNGAMRVSQENGATAGTTTGYYPADQFLVQFANAGAITAAQVASLTPAGSPNRLRVVVTTADASVAAGDLLTVQQPIEGIRVVDLKFGTGAAKSVTLQFGVKAPAGTYCVAFLNNTPDRSYIAEVVITGGEANTDVVKSVTLTGDLAGTWLTNSLVGLRVYWTLMAGTTFQTPAGAWTSGSYRATSNQTNFMATVSNTFELFDAGLYEGVTAPLFRVLDYEESLVRCQRFFRDLVPDAIDVRPYAGVCYSTTLFVAGMVYPEMRASPALIVVNPTNFGVLTGGVTVATTAIAIDTVSPIGCSLSLTVASGLTAGSAGLLRSYGTGKLRLNARLI